MIYVLIVALMLTLGMAYYIFECHLDISLYKGRSDFYNMMYHHANDGYMESLDKIISLEKELVETRILNIQIDKNEKATNNEGFVASMELAEDPNDKFVECKFRTCGPSIHISSVPDLIKEDEDG